MRAGGKCEVCGKDSKEVRLNSHHIIGRKFYPFRFNPRNGVCLCASHHKFAPDRSAHENPVWFFEWLKSSRAVDLKFLQGNYESALKVEYNDAIKILTIELNKLQKIK